MAEEKGLSIVVVSARSGAGRERAAVMAEETIICFSC